MDALTPEWVILGKFGRPQGIKGFIRVNSFAEPPENILNYPEWFINPEGKTWQPIKRLNERVTGQHVLAQIEGYPSRESLFALTNAEIAIPKACLPALNEGEFYWEELAGMRVTHTSGVAMGIVKEILATGANDVLVVVDEQNKRRLIPYLLDDVIQQINKESREITVDWDLDF